MSRSGLRKLALLVAAAFAVLTACGGSEVRDGPLVGDVGTVLDAVESYYGGPQEYLEISATAEVVAVIVAAADGAEQLFWGPDSGLADPVALQVPERPTFGRGVVRFDPAKVFSQLRAELPDSEIIDFAVTGVGDGAVVYDARVQSEQGGVLLVLLGPDGRILGAQGE